MAPLGNFRQSSYLQETALFLGQSEIFMDSSNLLSRLIGIDLSDKQTVRRSDRKFMSPLWRGIRKGIY